MAEAAREMSDSSTDTPDVEAPVEAVEAVDESTESPPSSDASETKEELLSVLEDAIKPKEEVTEPLDEAESLTAEPEAEEVRTVDEPIESESSEDESFKDVPFNKHPRFKQLIRERNEAREGSQKFDQIMDFMFQHSLTPDELAEGMQIMALMKNDPAKAAEALRPHMENMGRASGEILPEDLQGRLDEGYIDEDAASELARSRMEVQMARNRESQFHQQSAEIQRQDILTAAQTWMDDTASADPDFGLKQPLITDRVARIANERGRPRNADEGIAIVQEAHKQITDELRQMNSTPKQEIKPVGGGKISGTPMPEPKSIHDVIDLALQR